ncbi:MAG: hypothetical protein ACI90V_013092, partial [Bacillariaceae sp.]
MFVIIATDSRHTKSQSKTQTSSIIIHHFYLFVLQQLMHSLNNHQGAAKHQIGSIFI